MRGGRLGARMVNTASSCYLKNETTKHLNTVEKEDSLRIICYCMTIISISIEVKM